MFLLAEENSEPTTFISIEEAEEIREHAPDHVPELPNFIKILSNKFYGTSLGDFLHQWENIIFSILISTLIALVFYIGTRKRELVPRGLQNFLEMIVDALRSLIVGVLGHDGEKYVPLLGTLFIYVLTMNLFGLIPLMKSPSSNLNITAGLAITIFVLVQYLNIKNMGLGGFLYHLAGSPKGVMGWIMVPLLFPIELITQLSRPVTLSLRLFGNILGEDILIGAFAVFGIVLMASWHSPVGFPLQTPFMFLAILTSAMQALVFTLLSTVYILLSIPHTEEKHKH
jgi:F-type H+-transporting ATPase subunit a